MTKENQIALLPLPGKSVRVKNPFSWVKIQNFYNRIPFGITPCKSVYDAKMYTAVVFVGLSVVFVPMGLAALAVYRSAKRGGRR